MGEQGLHTVGLCCVSTGIFGFPLKQATHIALDTVRQWLEDNPSKLQRIAFVMFKAEEMNVYRRLLPCYFPRQGDIQVTSNLATTQLTPGRRDDTRFNLGLRADGDGFLRWRSERCTANGEDKSLPETPTAASMLAVTTLHGVSSTAPLGSAPCSSFPSPRRRLLPKKSFATPPGFAARPSPSAQASNADVPEAPSTTDYAASTFSTMPLQISVPPTSRLADINPCFSEPVTHCVRPKECFFGGDEKLPSGESPPSTDWPPSKESCPSNVEALHSMHSVASANPTKRTSRNSGQKPKLAKRKTAKKASTMFVEAERMDECTLNAEDDSTAVMAEIALDSVGVGSCTVPANK